MKIFFKMNKEMNNFKKNLKIIFIGLLGLLFSPIVLIYMLGYCLVRMYKLIKEDE